jgi:hypothetical protein
MFNEAEIGLFTNAGLNPVFFADTVIGISQVRHACAAAAMMMMAASPSTPPAPPPRATTTKFDVFVALYASLTTPRTKCARSCDWTILCVRVL